MDINDLNYKIPDDSHDEWIPADDVRKRLKMSPGEFVVFLEKVEIETSQEGLRRSYYQTDCEYAEAGYVPFFNIKDIVGLQINRFSWEKYIAGHGLPSDPATWPEEAKKKVTKLEARVAELEAQVANNVSPLPPDCADCRSEDQSVAARRQDIEAAVRLTAKVVEHGAKKSTEQHKALWKKERAPESSKKEVRKEAFAAFRRALPDKYKEEDPNKK